MKVATKNQEEYELWVTPVYVENYDDIVIGEIDISPIGLDQQKFLQTLSTLGMAPGDKFASVSFNGLADKIDAAINKLQRRGAGSDPTGRWLTVFMKRSIAINWFLFIHEKVNSHKLVSF